jgi:thiol:disulfide interchange protein DsbD
VKKLLLLAFFVVCTPALAALNLGSTDNLLEPEKAFRFSAQAIDGAVEVRFAIAEGYYLYRERFRFEATGAQLGKAEFPAGIPHKDEFFGEQQIYRKEVKVRIPAEASGPFDLKVTSQGCADVGVCYVPMESNARLALTAAGGVAAPSIFSSDVDIGRLFEGNVFLLVAAFFGFGLALAFTPCVLPMIPILSGIIAGEGEKVGKRDALILSIAYVLGMSVTYTAAGIAAAYMGSLLAALFQNVWVLAAFALVFVVLALSMFGFFDLQLPGFIHHRLHSVHHRLRGGRIASVAAMGALSAIIVSPCVAPPLAAALLEIARTGNVALGGSALFALSIGMGLPLIAVGVSEGALLPKAGAWMEGVRRFFGVLLLGVAVWIIAPVLPPMLTMLAWSALAIISAIFLRALDGLGPHATGWSRLFKGVGIMLLVAGIALLVGALAGSRDPLRPLSGLTAREGAIVATPWTRIASVAELDARLKQPGKPVMLDFYADWCVSCKEMESFTFSDPKVRAELDTLLLLQVDVTASNAEHKVLLKRFSLFGPPGIIFFDAQGREVKGLRVIGYQNPERFLRTLSLLRLP